MRYILAVWVIVVLVGLLIISLINLKEYGVNGMILAGISAVALYRIFRFLLESDDSEDTERSRPSGHSGFRDPLEYIMYGDIAGEGDPDD